MTLREFQQNLAPLIGAPLPGDQHRAELAVGAGRVTIIYESRPGLRLSGLLTMPVGLVTLGFENVSASDQQGFLKRFELAFQRGGG